MMTSRSYRLTTPEEFAGVVSSFWSHDWSWISRNYRLYGYWNWINWLLFSVVLFQIILSPNWTLWEGRTKEEIPKRLPMEFYWLSNY